MNRLLILFVVMLVPLAACAPAATPAPTQAPAQPAMPAPAQPTQGVIATVAPAAAAPTIGALLATGMPELKPPQSGGVLNPPTIVPTSVGNRAVTSGQTALRTFRDLTTGLTFQYPADWQQAINSTAANPQAPIKRIEISHLSQPIGHNVDVLIDVRPKRGELLTWVLQQLPTGSLILSSNYIEGGFKNLKDYNAKLNGLPAIFVYQPEHGSGTPDMAALFAADQQNFYQFTYHGDIPDDNANRLVYLRLLNTATLSGTTQSGVALPPTVFTSGVDLTQLK